MKKLSFILAAILILTTSLFVLASCDKDEAESGSESKLESSAESNNESETNTSEEESDTESQDTSEPEESEPAESEPEEDIFVYDIDRSKTKTNKALNKTYEVLDKDSNPVVEEQWVDEGGKELTDGAKGSASSGSDPAWMGIKAALMPATVTIDLGEAVEGIADFDIAAHINDGWGVDLPAKVTVQVSEDNETFYEAGSITLEELDVSRDEGGMQAEDISIQLEKGVKAQYVKFTFEPNDSWIFLSEIEISTYE